jgi:DNA-binding CsgD family transcriptional regulator
MMQILVGERTLENSRNDLAGFEVAHPVEEAKIPAWLGALLNDVGFGVLILDRELNVRFSNDAGRQAIAYAGLDVILQISDGCPQSSDARQFQSIARLAASGLRKLTIMGRDPRRIAIAMSPMSLGGPFDGMGVLVTIERKSVCESISLWGYGKVMGLTEGELKVLDQLTSGQEPKVAAAELNISVTTVRSHIRSMISKTESNSLRHLLMKVSRLPPIRTLSGFKSE